MSHRFAPNPSMPEFHVEAGYLTDFSYLWKMRLQGWRDETGKGNLDVEFLFRWQYHRRMLEEYSAPYGHADPFDITVRDCLRFVDALVLDWHRELSGKPPELPLDIARLQALGEHRNKLNDIPGDKWEIKY